MIISKLKLWWQSLLYYVIADPADNSITLSKRLFLHIKNNARKSDAARIFVFRISGDDTFGFIINPVIEQATQMCDIQYNDKYKCIGFETLCPSVGRILYEYGLSDNCRVKLSVSVQKTPQGKTYYKFDKPNAKYILKSATKLFSVLLASKRPLITELADKLRLKYPLLPTISPCPTMRLEAIRSIIPISCRRYPKSV